MSAIHLVLALAIFPSLTSGIATSGTFCVVPEETVATKHYFWENTFGNGVDCSENKTWNEYLADQPHYFNDVSDVTFYFYPGTHFMNRSLESQRSNNLLLMGASPKNVSLISTVSAKPVSLTFFNFSNVTVKGMNINQCNSVVNFTNGTDAQIVNILQEYNIYCGSGGIFFYSVGNLTIKDITQNVAFPFFYCVSGDVHVLGSHFKAASNGPIWQLHNADFVIDSCDFVNIFLYQDDIVNSTMLISNLHAIKSAIEFDWKGTHQIDHMNYSRSILTIVNTTLVNTALNITNNHNVLLKNLTVLAGYDTQVLSAVNSSLIIESFDMLNGFSHMVDFRACKVTIRDSNFTGIGKRISAIIFTILKTLLTIESSLISRNVGQIFYINESDVTISNSNFTENEGSVLVLEQSTVTFLGPTAFIGNKGASGAAIYIVSNALLYYGDVVFKSNKVSDTGGAIYIQQKQLTSCPFLPSLPGVMMFEDNFAFSGGNDIYGGDLDQSFVYPYITECIQKLKRSSSFPDDVSSISSSPSRVCLCTNDGKPDCLKLFHSTSVYPGESVQLSAVAVGQNFGTAFGFVNAQLIDLSRSQEKYRSVLAHACNTLSYTINSMPGVVPIALTTTISEFDDLIMNTEEASKIIHKYNPNQSYYPAQLLDTPVIVDVTVLKCPLGFKLYSLPTRCDCFDSLKHLPGVSCQISERELTRSGNVWIGSNGCLGNWSSNDTSSLALYTKYCPYNYCNTSKVNIFNKSSNVLCNWNRSGRLCGECPNGMSLTLGTSHCKHCSNKYLSLLLLFALAGILLVVFLKLTNLTTAGGLVNGLILYANLVKAGSYVYFPSSIFLTPFRVFIDWLNLDFGIEVCFFDGLDGYWKTWLQFVFPLYLWIISLTMILLARYSFRMSRLLGNNSVPVLATLFTLSYAKIFRVIMTALKYTVLEEVNGDSFTVWSYDGSIEYFTLKHTILFIIVIVVLVFLWLPYTLVLLFAQCLQRCNVPTISKLVFKMKPLIDAHCGSFTDKHRYWFGLLLLSRSVPLLVGTASSTNADINTILSTTIVIGLLLSIKKEVYTAVLVSISETVFLLNILFLSLMTLYVQYVGSPTDQVIVSGFFVGFSFLHFAVIVTWSTVKNVRNGCHRIRGWIPMAINAN